MESRDFLKKTIVTGLEEGYRNSDIKNHINLSNLIDESAIEKKVNDQRKFFDDLAEKWIRDFETYLLLVLGERIATTVQEKMTSHDIAVKESIHELILSNEKNHSCLLGSITGVYDFQKKARMQILEEEIEKIGIYHNILKRHQDALDKKAKLESRKVSWMFLLIAIVSTSAWIYVIVKWKWEKVEQWTFILGSGCVLFLFNSLYYAIFERHFTSESLQKEKYEKLKLEKYDIHKFDVLYLETIKTLLEKKKEEYSQLTQKK